MNEFERMLEHIGDELFRTALIQVADTAEMSMRWFKAQGLTPSAADVLDMSRMVLRREEQIKREAELGDDP